MRYRRADVAGGTYFFTINLAERNRTLLVDHVDVLRAVMQKVKAKHPFHIDAMVILPDHLHAVWTLPVGDCDYPTRWMLIKTGFSRQIPKAHVGVRYEPQHFAAVGITLGFLRHHNLRLLRLHGGWCWQSTLSGVDLGIDC